MHHVVAGALVSGGRVLLAHRCATRRWYPDVWDFPGGHVDPGESELDALVRELHEELGVRVREVDQLPVARLEDVATEMRLAVWAVHRWQGTPVNRAPDEHDELRWVTRQDLAELALAHPAYPRLVDRLLSGVR
ncbi:NUDIX domain-containing protein [Modestobacter sp. I12A-02628]|uniref:8-oxo-dGTP diphosphatase n=1 Tax=Goekera deserti TaxID=2497753 RepID=A0A7K3WIE6_9ACTN|nr:NUDIX domain-containing protein [Goekera deserti]MPQ96667.1 NUDIX domain-containing protein [Goekera deserti]NDI47022.1 NUDIX domain-containing protein [Goekera deserti]NEL56258.1 NUDIX domain-containing protein [Goekera deserti]